MKIFGSFVDLIVDCLTYEHFGPTSNGMRL